MYRNAPLSNTGSFPYCSGLQQENFTFANPFSLSVPHTWDLELVIGEHGLRAPAKIIEKKPPDNDADYASLASDVDAERQVIKAHQDRAGAAETVDAVGQRKNKHDIQQDPKVRTQDRDAAEAQDRKEQIQPGDDGTFGRCCGLKSPLRAFLGRVKRSCRAVKFQACRSRSPDIGYLH